MNMNANDIKISLITEKITSNPQDDFYAVCWIKHEIQGIEIDQILYENVANAVFFLNPGFDWKIIKKVAGTSSGYILYLPHAILNNPVFKNLHISEVRLFSAGEIPKINLTPGIEKRVQAILEMLDELVSTNLKHKEEAILSLLNTFFVYCDGKCNIKSVIHCNNAKSSLVYKFKKVVDQRFAQYHEVGDYAKLLNISDKYLNECVKEVLGTNAKNLIDEQLSMIARHQLKFTDKTIKEISYDLGFSSPEYFSFFVKKQSGSTPTQLRKE
ncbi:AraC family transcriptional activator of pobA [Catalinimonas alkaloidigena]|uniref:helix-turn-helix domain-containing protein n=1 Tax=Catalinimonas alkaloidigena TaxID=1075417 RepID=UPI00240718DB|nr:helix-turn-helix domain-containing protein [Catalinimonas alkaloidigena]MDF9798063.1 AraC family transcriptional activator of pobA [Catalinimonas alkaloidigena]